MYTIEDKLQADFHQHHWNMYPHLRKKWWSVPNGGYRNKIEAMKMKATGLISGVWDVHFYNKGQLSIIEFKVGTNKLTKEQIEWGEIMAKEGAIRYVAYNLEDAKKYFKIIFAV